MESIFHEKDLDQDDIVSTINNISNDINKCAKRYYLKNSKTKALFLQYDTSKSIKGGEGCIGEHNERNKLMLDILYNRQRALPKELRPLVPKYKGLCKKGFDIISSQFSIHYYFKDELTLRTYIQNISENIKKGGFFIGTCYDGMKVFQMLEKTESGYLEMIDEFLKQIGFGGGSVISAVNDTKRKEANKFQTEAMTGLDNLIADCLNEIFALLEEKNTDRQTIFTRFLMNIVPNFEDLYFQ